MRETSQVHAVYRLFAVRCVHSWVAGLLLSGKFNDLFPSTIFVFLFFSGCSLSRRTCLVCNVRRTPSSANGIEDDSPAIYARRFVPTPQWPHHNGSGGRPFEGPFLLRRRADHDLQRASQDHKR